MTEQKYPIPAAMVEAAARGSRNYIDSVNSIENLTDIGVITAALEGAGVGELLTALETMVKSFRLDVYRMAAGNAFCDMEAAEQAVVDARVAIAKAKGGAE